MEAREGPNAEDKGDRLMAATGHHQVMIPPGVAGRVHDGRKCQYILAPSVLQSRHFRVKAFDRRHTMQWLTRVTVYGTVMFEFQSSAWNFTSTFVLESSLSPLRQNWTLRHFDPGMLVLWPVTRRATRILCSSVFDVFSIFRVSSVSIATPFIMVNLFRGTRSSGIGRPLLFAVCCFGGARA